MTFLLLLAELSDENREFVMMIYNKYGDFMYKVAMDIVENKEDADDVVNDAMCKIIRHISKFEGETADRVRNQIVMSVRTIVSNQAKDRYKEMKKQKNNEQPFYYQVSDDEDDYRMLEIEDESMNVEQLVISKDTTRIVKQALLTLSKDLQDAVNLVYMSGYSCVEAANFLEISDGAVRARLYKARHKLKEILIKELKGYDKE